VNVRQASRTAFSRGNIRCGGEHRRRPTNRGLEVDQSEAELFWAKFLPRLYAGDG